MVSADMDILILVKSADKDISSSFSRQGPSYDISRQDLPSVVSRQGPSYGVNR